MCSSRKYIEREHIILRWLFWKWHLVQVQWAAVPYHNFSTILSPIWVFNANLFYSWCFFLLFWLCVWCLCLWSSVTEESWSVSKTAPANCANRGKTLLKMCFFFFFFADKVKWQKLVEWLVHYKLLPHKLLVVNKKGVCVVKRSLRSGLSEWRNICQALLRSMCLWCNSCIHCFRPPIKVPTWYTALGVTGKKFYEREKCEFAA